MQQIHFKVFTGGDEHSPGPALDEDASCVMVAPDSDFAVVKQSIYKSMQELYKKSTQDVDLRDMKFFYKAIELSKISFKESFEQTTEDTPILVFIRYGVKAPRYAEPSSAGGVVAIRMTKAPGSRFGFVMDYTSGRITTVTAPGLAMSNGMKEGMVILTINDIALRDLPPPKIEEFLKGDSLSLTLLPAPSTARESFPPPSQGSAAAASNGPGNSCFPCFGESGHDKKTDNSGDAFSKDPLLTDTAGHQQSSAPSSSYGNPAFPPPPSEGSSPRAGFPLLCLNEGETLVDEIEYDSPTPFWLCFFYCFVPRIARSLVLTNRRLLYVTIFYTPSLCLSVGDYARI